MTATAGPVPGTRLRTVLRDGDSVKPLELFFDLVFVLAITQCTALMADSPTWDGLARGLLMLALLWWSWVGYAWLTSVLDPEEGAVRLVIFGAMAALLVAALCVPAAFGESALLFACAYAVVRVSHILLFVVASRGDARLRRSVVGLAGGTAVGVTLIVVASFLDGAAQGAVWVAAIAFDMGAPLLIGVEGWTLVPKHFAERHALIFIVALGESIVAIGVGAERGVDAGVVVAAVLGMAVAAALWWLYFDVVAIVAERRLSQAAPGRERNSLARDSYSFLHFPMVAGVVLIALGMKKTLGHVGDPLEPVPAVALLGGTAVYLLGHVAFRLRNVGTLSRPRATAALAAVALVPAALVLPALATLAIVTALLAALVSFEALRYAEARDRIRHARGHGAAAAAGSRTHDGGPAPHRLDRADDPARNDPGPGQGGP